MIRFVNRNNSSIRKVSALQEDILKTQPHLAEAAIPVQDLHLTLFIATLHEQDGTLQVLVCIVGDVTRLVVVIIA